MALYERTGNRRTDSSRINKIINQDLEEINRKYTQIGRIVKLRCLDQITDSEVLGIAAEVDAKLSELRELQDELNAVNGVKVCAKCNAKIDINVAFCPSCGAKQSSAAHAAVPASAPAVPVPPPAPIPAPAPVPPVQPVQPVQPIPPVQPAAPQYPEYSEATTYAGNDEFYEEAPAFGEQHAPVIPEPVPVPVSQQPKQQPSASVIFCTQCGSKEPAGTRFCSQCGSIIG